MPTAWKHRKRPTLRNTTSIASVDIEIIEVAIDLHPDRIDLATLLDRYVRDRAALGRGAKTVERDEELVRLYLKPHIGSIALSKLKPAHVTELLTRLSERGGVKGRPRSAKSVSDAFALQRGALGWAQRQELVARNVADVVETPSIPRGRAIALSVEEVHVLLAAADETRWGPFLRVALGCGARRGELLALRWSDVDFENTTLTIAKSLSETRAHCRESDQDGSRPDRRAAGARDGRLSETAPSAGSGTASRGSGFR
jgi:integrase